MGYALKMKRLLIPLIAALTLPTAVNANLIDEYRQQESKGNKCNFMAENYQWINFYEGDYFYIDYNRIIEVEEASLWNGYQAICKQIGILNQEYRYTTSVNYSDRQVTTLSRFENDNLVIYHKNRYGNGEVKKIIYYKR